MNTDNTDWHKSVAAVVIKDNKVLLGRHTYGAGKGKLIIPGGYLEKDELPEDAVKREVFEETNININPTDIIGIRFNQKDWYVIFSADYNGGIAKPNDEENSEVLWLDVEESLKRSDVPDLTKKAIESALGKHKLENVSFYSNERSGKNSYYG